MARPSNQWSTRRSPASNLAGVTRTSAPVSQAGSAPLTGRLPRPSPPRGSGSPAVVRRVRVRHCRCHGQDCTVHSGLMQGSGSPLPPTSSWASSSGAGRRHAVRAQGDGCALDRELLDPAPRPALQRARASGEGGYVTEERERGGRRRKTYTITAKGGRRSPNGAPSPPGRCPSCATRRCSSSSSAPTWPRLAPLQMEAHRRKPGRIRGDPRDACPPVPDGPRMALDAGID